MSEAREFRIRGGDASAPVIEVMVRGSAPQPPPSGTRSGTRGGVSTRSAGVVDQTTSAVTDSFEDVLGGLRHIADSLTNVMSESDRPPDEMTVSFGVNFSAAARIVIVEGNSNASLNVNMTWRREAGD